MIFKTQADDLSRRAICIHDRGNEDVRVDDNFHGKVIAYMLSLFKGITADQALKKSA